MATDDISVSIGVQGESKFKKALAECQNTVKQLDSALKANAAEYEANADALGENVERTKLLSKSIELQKKMAEGLGDAIEHATKEYGAASRQTTQYVVAQNKAKEAVAKLEKELKESDRELEELGRDSVRVGRQLDQGVSEGAKEAAKNLGEMYEELQTEVDDIKSLMGADLFGDLAGGAFEIAEGVADFVAGTRESRRQLSYLQQNAKSMGIPFDEVEDTLYRVAAITGDIEGAYEGVNNLINTGFSAKEIADAADLLTAAAIKWPETMKFEGMAESLQETVATKNAVGAYAELLERMGIDLEVVNKALKKTKDSEATQDVALSFLANRGLEQHLAEYQVLNETMIASQDAANQLDAAWAKLGGTVEKWTGPMVKVMAEGILTIDQFLNKADKVGEQTRDEFLEELRKKSAGVFGPDDEPIIRTDWKEALENIWNGLQEGGESLIDILIPKASAEELTGAEEEGKEIGESVIGGVETAISDATPGIQTAAQTLVDKLSQIFGEPVIPDWAGAVSDQMDSINEIMNRSPALRPGWNLNSGGSGMEEQGNPLHVSLNIDGRKFASATVDYYNEAQGRQINMNV